MESTKIRSWALALFSHIHVFPRALQYPKNMQVDEIGGTAPHSKSVPGLIPEPFWGLSIWSLYASVQALQFPPIVQRHARLYWWIEIDCKSECGSLFVWVCLSELTSLESLLHWCFGYLVRQLCSIWCLWLLPCLIWNVCLITWFIACFWPLLFAWFSSSSFLKKISCTRIQPSRVFMTETAAPPWSGSRCYEK